MIKVLYTNQSVQLSAELTERLLPYLPGEMQERNGRYHRWQDRQCHLLGKMLLLRGLLDLGYGSDSLSRVEYTEFDRPYIPGLPDFNISHSKGLVACAFTQKGKIGMDVEFVSSINLKDLLYVMSAPQKEAIMASHSPAHEFIRYWTIKEAAIKAEGSGLQIDLSSIEIQRGKVLCNNVLWNLRRLYLAKDYMASLVTDHDISNVVVNEIIPNDLMD